MGLCASMHRSEDLHTLLYLNVDDGHVFVFARIKHLNLHLGFKLIRSLKEINAQNLKIIYLKIPEYH